MSRLPNTTAFRRLEQLRRERSELDNNVIDNLIAGRLDRRAFLRHGSRLGLSAALMGSALGTVGLAGLRPARAQGAPGATIRVAQITPSGAINPVTVADQGGLLPLQIVGDFLVMDGPDLVLRPMLATEWSANEEGTVWTFKLREGVKFHDGGTMTADDVVASIKRLADPANGSNALSAFKGVLSPGGIKKIDDLTVEFTLDAPNGNFPYYVSTDNYNAIIVPADTDPDAFEGTMIATGPFKRESYTPKVGATYVRNEDYWAGPPLPARIELNFYDDLQPQVLGLLGGQIDVIQQVNVQGARPLLDNPAAKILQLKANTHRQVHMKTREGPFADKRIRQAMALTIDRQKLVDGLFQGMASLGNDSPFAPVFPSTDTSVPQRARDIDKAKALMAEAGATSLNTTLTTMQMQELPTLATLLKNFGAEIGIEIELKIEDVGAYYGDAVPGKSDWLDSEFGITDYGHRGTPNVFLSAPLLSTGTWNSANFDNPTYDKLVADYIAAVDLEVQTELAGKIQTLLLDETPIIFPYFYDYLSATGPTVAGVETTAMGQIFLTQATKG